MDSKQITRKIDHIELLVPELATASRRDLQSCALAYVEHYGNDVLQLEHGWEFLYCALAQAWQKEEYGVVVRLVAALAYSAGRISSLAVAEHILQMGVEASHRTGDREQHAAFLNRLGTLVFSRGNYRQGRRIWRSSLELAVSSGAPHASHAPLPLWEPLSTFAHIADILDDDAEVAEFVETVLRASHSGSADEFAVAVFIRGFYARMAGQLEAAHDDFSYSLRLLSQQTLSVPHSSYRQLFSMVVQSEMARVEGDYARSQEYTETALTLTQLFADRFTLVDLLLDQLRFAYSQGQFDDAHSASSRLCEVVNRDEDPYFYKRCLILEHQLTQRLPGVSNGQELLPRFTAPTDQVAPTAAAKLQEMLSEREREVLQLVAEGFSNREIAACLIVTCGTVKKHLEHIYAKLGVHGRTAAIARARSLTIIA